MFNFFMEENNEREVTMNRAELIEAMSAKTNQSKAATEEFLNAFIWNVTKHIEDGVKLVGFGTFKVADRKARVARNPQTGEPIQIPARKVPVFKPGVDLKKKILNS